MRKDKIYIIGFGAIGKALAVFLTMHGKNVVVIRGSVNDGSRIHEEVTLALPDGTILKQTIEIITLKSVEKIDGLTVLTMKSFVNNEFSSALKPKVGNTPVVLLQNGFNVEKPFLTDGIRNLYRCVLFATSQVLENGVVNFRPITDSPVGIIKGDLSTLYMIVEQMDTPYFRFKPEANIRTVIWKKAIMNTVFNSVCPLLEADNGIFFREPSALHIARNLMKSCIYIAEKAGIRLSQTELESSLMNISAASEGQLISTLQDINNGRQTEIDTFNFEIYRIAEENGISTEAREILLLGKLIKLKEKINLKSGKAI